MKLLLLKVLVFCQKGINFRKDYFIKDMIFFLKGASHFSLMTGTLSHKRNVLVSKVVSLTVHLQLKYN